MTTNAQLNRESKAIWKRWAMALATALAAVALLVAATAPPSERSGPATQPSKTAPTLPPEKPYGQAWEVVRPGQHDQYDQRQSLRRRGQIVYGNYCIGCHGEKGDGKGIAAARLITQPRDFSKGIFKFRSTDSSSLPLDSDLHKTITRGLPGTAMPSFALMPEEQKLAVIEYVKTFYPAWDAKAPERKIVFVPQAPADLESTQRINRGQLVYLNARCALCHGDDGAGNGATQIVYTDAWGHTQRPKDFTKGRLKSGDAPEDLYRVFRTGLRSIMPTFGAETFTNISRDGLDPLIPAQSRAGLAAALADFPANAADVAALGQAEQTALAERNGWDLVAYLRSLRNRAGAAQKDSP